MSGNKGITAFNAIKELIGRPEGATREYILSEVDELIEIEADQFNDCFSVFFSVIYEDSEERFHFIDDMQEQIEALEPYLIKTAVCPCCGHELVPGATVSIPRNSDLPAKEYRSGKGAYERVISAINELEIQEPLFFKNAIETLSNAMPSESPGVIRTALLGIYKQKKYSDQISIGEAIGDDGKYHKTWGRK